MHPYARVAKNYWHSWSILLALGLAVLLVPVPQRVHPPQERTFRLEASQFAYSPSIIKVNPGDRVTIELVSLDVVHGLALDGYGYAISADPGQPAKLTFTADRTGVFRLRCSVTCGNMHPFMTGKLLVGRNDLLWRGVGLSMLLVFGLVWRRIS